MAKILVLEDVRVLREEIITMLELMDYEVVAAENGMIGVQLAKIHVPDVIVCDVMMPELDGYGVLAMLQQDPETANIPFIFLSAKADRSDIRQGMNLGADDYLTKPFTSDELYDAIESRLSKREAITQPYISEMKQAVESLSQAAFKDPLTNLPNRIMLRHRLQDSLLQAKLKQRKIAILSLNINNFKSVNSTVGLMAGDQLLQEVASRLRDCVGPDDVAARLSGDEFCIVLSGRTSAEEVENWAVTLLEILSEPYELGEQAIQVSFRVGMTLYPEDDSSVDKLLNHVEATVQSIQTRSSNNYQWYSSDLSTALEQKQWLSIQLKNALERSEFEVYYQPQINLITKRIIGVEALLRWHNPESGLILPAHFIPVAEETGAIVAIGEWVLQEACQQVQSWNQTCVVPLRISVNLSARQLQSPKLFPSINQILEKLNFDPSLLILEITETSLMENLEASIQILLNLKQKGIQIALDDFGTGYSSLNHLNRLPIDILKIDQSFISNTESQSSNLAVITAIIAIAQNLKLKVIAEGVETQEQRDFLQKNGCHAIQGYFFSRPLTATQFTAFLKEHADPTEVKPKLR